jgi:hypothetical protein
MDNQDNSRERMPRWARRIDDAGPRRWKRERNAKRRRGDYIANIVVNLIGLYIVNKLPSWHVSFLNDHYLTILPMINWNIYVQIAGNFLLVFLDLSIFRYLLRAVMEAATFLILIILFYIYPFNFTLVENLGWLDTFLPVIFIIGMVVSAVKVLSNLWKMVFWR